MGQRAAAKAARAKFKLEKFSHSTVSRSFRALEQSRKQSLEHRFGEEIVTGNAERPQIVGAAAKNEVKSEKATKTGRLFPAVMETGGRRKEMAAFLREYLNACKDVNIEIASRRFIEGWHKRNRRLIL
jgi:hypothetical protein